MLDQDLKDFSKEVKEGFVEALGDKSSFFVKNVFVDEVEETEEESMFDRSLEIQDLKLKEGIILMWGEDCEDVKIFKNKTEEEFNELASQFEDYSSYHSGTNDDEMFEILFSMDDETAYDLIEDYYEEWGKYIEIIN